jgi:hypothetical protein
MSGLMIGILVILYVVMGFIVSCWASIIAMRNWLKIRGRSKFFEDDFNKWIAQDAPLMFFTFLLWPIAIPVLIMIWAVERSKGMLIRGANYEPLIEIKKPIKKSTKPGEVNGASISRMTGEDRELVSIRRD